MPTPVYTTEIWQEMLQDILVEAGTTGLAQREIVKRMENHVLAEDILNELEFLLNCNPPKVQKFMVKGRGRPKTVWRATIHILKGT